MKPTWERILRVWPRLARLRERYPDGFSIATEEALQRSHDWTSDLHCRHWFARRAMSRQMDFNRRRPRSQESASGRSPSAEKLARKEAKAMLDHARALPQVKRIAGAAKPREHKEETIPPWATKLGAK